jgi:hypothetical protein
MLAGAPALLLSAWFGGPALAQVDGGEFPKEWFYGDEAARAAHAALAGKEAPELHVSDWKNVDADFEKKLADGFQWEDLEGKVVLIDYWATW